MPLNNSTLWTQILAFDLDDPSGEYGFTTRLANENFWTKNFSIQAIVEYKKFMYLAAVSDSMVSPSEIVDQVWHQHLIFTQSYQAFCSLLGKQIQHIPSTHNKQEADKFRLAKERTKKIYLENFGKQPPSIWEYSSMYDSLHLNKARLKIRTFLIIGILSFLLLIIPFYYVLKRVYVQIDNPDFILRFLFLSVVSMLLLEFLNKKQLNRIISHFDKDAFIFQLEPLELVYLKTQKLTAVVNGVVNELVDDERIAVKDDYSISMSGKGNTKTLEELQVMNSLHEMGSGFYPALLARLLKKPLFFNTANCMNAFRKYFNKSKKFSSLFYANFVVLSTLIMLGLIRMLTGIVRDRPITFIAIALLALTVLAIFYLLRLTRLVCQVTIPQYYKANILPNLPTRENWQWSYFSAGPVVFAAAFMPIATYVDKRNPDYGGSTDGSSDSSCGSSCGSSCSSCGGCGGGD